MDAKACKRKGGTWTGKRCKILVGEGTKLEANNVTLIIRNDKFKLYDYADADLGVWDEGTETTYPVTYDRKGDMCYYMED